LKYLRSTTFQSKDIGVRKSEFVAQTQYLHFSLTWQGKSKSNESTNSSLFLNIWD